MRAFKGCAVAHGDADLVVLRMYNTAGQEDSPQQNSDASNCAPFTTLTN